MSFYNLVFFKFINDAGPYNVANAEIHDVNLDFRFGLQTVMGLKGLC